jgi:hypothetical protein
MLRWVVVKNEIILSDLVQLWEVEEVNVEWRLAIGRDRAVGTVPGATAPNHFGSEKKMVAIKFRKFLPGGVV